MSTGAGDAGRQKFALTAAASTVDVFDPSTYNTSGGLPAENLGRYLISQEARRTQIAGESRHTEADVRAMHSERNVHRRKTNEH